MTDTAEQDQWKESTSKLPGTQLEASNIQASPDGLTSSVQLPASMGSEESERYQDAADKREDHSCTEKVFEIILEQNIPPEQRDETSLDKIYYFPLTMGTTMMRANEDLQDSGNISGFSSDRGSSTILRELGQSLSASGECEGAQKSDANQSDLLSGGRSLCNLFLNPGATLITEKLVKDGSIPESIAQQFNEIAKLTKNSLRSRRTVRTTFTRLVPGISTCVPMNVSTAGIPDPNASSATTDFDVVKKGSSHLLSSGSIYTHANQKPPFHARFHSDETTITTDYSVHSPFYLDSRKSDDSPATESSSSSTSIKQQPMTYVRSVTAERLPLFVRPGVGVLRSKSSASAVPHERPAIPAVNAIARPVQTDNESGPGCSPRSLPESVVSSQCQSETHPASNDGSTNSLPSLSMRGSTGTNIDVTGQTPGLVPTSSDPSIPTDSYSIEVGSRRESVVLSPSNLVDGHHHNDNHVRSLKRRHIIKELIQVEKDYVSALATLVNAYMIPLRQEKILDDQQLDVIFYKVNDLYNFHMSFLNTLQMWELTNTVGDKLLDMFSRDAVAACYCSFVENFPNSEKTLEACWNTKSSFQRFCEQRLRTLRSKLPLKALLVQPVQRIPRYELLVKRLIEYTPKEYADNALLLEAKIAIHRLAVRVNEVRADGQDESVADGMKLLERLLAPATLTANRCYIRHDMVSMEDRKDPVCIFMFTDQIVFTIAKRRGNQMIKKPLFLRLQSPRGVDTIENIKYKTFHRLAIEAIELEPCNGNETERLVQHRELRDKKDLALLAEIENISGKLDYRHHDLELVVRQLYRSVQQELEDLRTARYASNVIPKNLSVFTATTKEGIERYELTFPSMEKREDWERMVMELKRQLSTVKRTSKFHTRLEISPTLSGIQFSCAAAVEPVNNSRSNTIDIWICAADGYTGYICMLGLNPNPMINLISPLSGCNSRISCICAVPGFSAHCPRRVSAVGGPHRLPIERSRSQDQRSLHLPKEEKAIKRGSKYSDDGHSSLCYKQVIQPVVGEPLGFGHNKEVPSISHEDLSSTLHEGRVKKASSSTIVFSSDSPSLEDPWGTSRRGNESKHDETNSLEDKSTSLAADHIRVLPHEINMSLSGAQEEQGTSENTDSSDPSEEEQEAQEETCNPNGFNQIATELQVRADNAELSTTSQTGSPRITKSTRLLDPHRPTMWIGTEDGSVLIFYATDNIKTTRQRQCIALSSAVTSILHLDTRIFVSNANGDFLVYDRNSDGLWNTNSPRFLNISPENGNEPVVVRRMLAVAGNVWCAAHRFIYVLNSVTLKVELSFPLNGNPADPRGIQQMAYGNQTVWLATENSPRLSLYHATTGEFLMEIDLKPVVLQSLQHCDEIIKRHKEACLRITCLTVCKDLLWVGTSAGIIVTLAIPRVHLGSTQGNMEQPQLEILKHGHIGHVRFLVSVESTTAVKQTKQNVLTPMHETIHNEPDHENVTESQDLMMAKRNAHQTEITEMWAPSKEHDSNASLTAPNFPHEPEHLSVTNAELAGTTIESKTMVRTKHLKHGLLGVRRVSVNPCATIATQMKVISGGDGYEEYVAGDRHIRKREPNIFGSIGDKDFHNYVLIWDVN